MANFHLYSKAYLQHIQFTKNDLIVEIGSENGEGSTAYFDAVAKNKQVDFYSVDVIDNAKKKCSHLEHTNWAICESGSKWADEQLPLLDKKIRLLYLDNYDWLHNTKSPDPKIVSDYKKRGIVVSNLSCQQEHLMQMIKCLPYMHDNSMIICDDTPFQEHSGIYIGKCGAVIPYLLLYDYEIVKSSDNGVILVRK